MLDTKRLRAFHELAAWGSFTAAADALECTQPAISHQIAQLEKELGAPVVERRTRRFQLTPVGEVLLSHARTILANVADAERAVADALNTGARQLRVAAFPTASATILPPVIAAFRSSNPHVELRLNEADPPAALPLLTGGDCDLALIYRYPILRSPEEGGIDLEPLFADQMAIALPAGHPLSNEAQVHLAALAGESWVAPHDSVCRDALVLACRTNGFSPSVVSETNDYTAMLGLVTGRVGVALIPRLAANLTANRGVVLRPLADKLIERLTFIASRRGAYRSPTVDTIETLLRLQITVATPPDLPLEPLESSGSPAPH
jgi:DNA-binding transcriptional LysR family regulator